MISRCGPIYGRPSDRNARNPLQIFRELDVLESCARQQFANRFLLAESDLEQQIAVVKERVECRGNQPTINVQTVGARKQRLQPNS